ncbi:transcriptional regulator [Horticoccus luteus]|uniref:Transcriptional regulator n=1 Tax=Horticoccus luteus TaxID=2862869 RepID=A0A8F9XIF2_9BACT|nr:helix-turn-helix domain-containing protein [Horticoccus luteus]QYM77528.1 transcriptional regulator [Horticoccus luteus]
MKLLPDETAEAVRPSDASAVVSPEFEQACGEFFTDLVGVVGIPRSVGQIYGLLFASPVPLGFTDIAQRLDISKGSASQGLRLLQSLGAVRSAGTSGDRRELFWPETRLRRLVSGILREKVEPLVSADESRMARLRELARATPDAAGAAFSEDQVKLLETWRRQMWLLLPILKTLLGPAPA